MTESQRLRVDVTVSSGSLRGGRVWARLTKRAESQMIGGGMEK